MLIDHFSRLSFDSKANIVYILILFGTPVVVSAYRYYVSLKISRRSSSVRDALEKMAKVEPNWSESRLLAEARTLFLEVKQALSDRDYHQLSLLLAPELYAIWEPKIRAKVADGSFQVMDRIIIEELRIVGAQNFADDGKDSFTACIDARDGNDKANHPEPFQEFWVFAWSKDRWLVKDVVEASNWDSYIEGPIVFEAKRNQKAS